MDQLPPLDPITRLSPLILRILGHNPSKFTLQGTNTYLIGHGPQRILLDTGEGKPEWKTSLSRALAAEGPDVCISDIILTHWHADHVGGAQDVLDLMQEQGKAVPKIWKNQPACTAHPIPDNKTFHFAGGSLRALHTPGHTTDHMCLFLPEESALFTGDNVLGHGTAVFEDLATYMSSLEKMSRVEGFAGRAYPAHGDVIADGKAKVLEYIRHRREREEQILGVLGQGGEWGSMEIVEVVYKGYPENLFAPAEGGVKQVLKKLEGDGKVAVLEGSGKWKLKGETAAL